MNIKSLSNQLLKFIGILSVILGNIGAKGQVSAYTFSQTSGSYASLSSPTVLGTATGNTATTNLNSNIYSLNLPFNFIFNGNVYSSLNIFDNGFITFGTTVPSGTTTGPISSNLGYDGAISVFGRDLTSFYNINNVSGEVSYEIFGSAPNREVIIQWKNFRPNYSIATTLVYSFSFQISLQETSGIIKMIYDNGNYLVGNTSISGSAQVGLRGTSNTDFINRNNTSSEQFNNSTAGTSTAGAQFFSTVNSTPGMPMGGLTYTWTPPSCFAPSGLSSGIVNSNSSTISWNAPLPNPSGYDIYYSTSNINPTASTTPTIQNVTGTSATLPSLMPLTRYYIWIRSNCGGSTSTWTFEPLVITTTCQPLSVLSTNGATVCNNTAMLSATADTGADINWYDAQSGGNLVGSGSTFTTPIINSTTNYWVTASTGTGNISTSKSIYSTSPSSGAGTTNFGLVFNALNIFTLEQVTIYPVSSTGASGSVTIDLIDSSGNILNSKTVNVIGAPTATPIATLVDLNFIIFPGTNYKLRLGGMSGITGLLFDPTANAVGGSQGYPFTVSNVLTITSSTLTAAPTNTPRVDLYYYFYNWKVSTKCESARTMVTATAGVGCLSTAEIKTLQPLKIYPNPFTEVINIDKPELIKSINLTDISGKLIRKNIHPENSLHLDYLLSGVYILVLHMKDGSYQSLKIIKK